MPISFARMLLGACVLLTASGALGQDSGRPDPLRFAVIGDSGTGSRQQREIAQRMATAWQRLPFEFVLMLGDNMYGAQEFSDFQEKFERPYSFLLNAGVKFYAVLGNHDELSQRYYPPFNLRGRPDYTFAPRPDVRIIGLDSTRMDDQQLRWLDRELARPASQWTIVFMHHPLYSSGKRHGPSLDLRKVLEPRFARRGVQAVFAGHEHFYERHQPQNGIHYFISGAAGQLRKGNIQATDQTACGFDRDNSFMLLELGQDALHFQAISREGAVIDQGKIFREGHVDEHSVECSASR